MPPAPSPQANPIVLNTRGEPASPIYWSGAYKVEVRDALGNLIYTVDNYNTDPAGLWNLGYSNAGTKLPVEQAFDLLYRGIKNPSNPKYAGGAKGTGVDDDYAALQACYSDPSSPYVNIPAGQIFLTKSTIGVPSGTVTLSSGGQVKGSGLVGVFSLAYPSVGTVFDGLVIDGGKTSGTADVVTLIYAAGSVVTPDNKAKRLIVRNCTLRNASAGIAFENAQDCSVHDNHIEAMYRHTAGAYAGSYGYGVVFNGLHEFEDPRQHDRHGRRPDRAPRHLLASFP
jgi:hypothetical protein